MSQTLDLVKIKKALKDFSVERVSDYDNDELDLSEEYFRLNKNQIEKVNYGMNKAVEF